MKRIVFFLTAMFVCCMASAVDISQLRQKGLPPKAVPASLYFENLYSNAPRTYSMDDIAGSTLVGLDEEFSFFVEALPSTSEDDFIRINLWMYDLNKDRVTKIFSQQGKEHEDLFIMGIDWLLDKQSSFKDEVIEETKQKISVQQFSGRPVVVLRAEVFTGVVHAPQMTLLVYPDSDKVKKLENQKLVSVAHTLSNMLMMAEIEYAQDYIITTSTEMRSEKQPLKENSEYILFFKQYLKPTFHIYSARGVELGSTTLPEDEIDMIR